MRTNLDGRVLSHTLPAVYVWPSDIQGLGRTDVLQKRDQPRRRELGGGFVGIHRRILGVGYPVGCTYYVQAVTYYVPGRPRITSRTPRITSPCTPMPRITSPM